MTSINMIVGDKRAYFLTDTSVYNEEMVITGFKSKVHHIRRWPGAVTGSGSLHPIAQIAGIAEQAPSVDDLFANTTFLAPLQRALDGLLERIDTMRPMRQQFVAWARDPMIRPQMVDQLRDFRGDPEALLEWILRALTWNAATLRRMMVGTYMVIGWSEAAGRPVGRVFELQPGGRPRWFEPENGITLQPAPSSAGMWRLHREGAQPHADYVGSTFDPERHAMPLMNMFRRQAGHRSFDKAVHHKNLIGGQAELTTVDQNGSRTEVLHDWQDQTGQPIQPERDGAEKTLPIVAPSFLSSEPELAREWIDHYQAGEIDPETLMPKPSGNRKERRRFEKQKRTSRGA